MLPAQNENYRNYIVKYNQNVYGPVAYQSDITFQIINDLYGVIYISAEQQPDIMVNSYSYASIPKCFTYMDLEALNTSNITRLHNHPFLQLRGRGTMVAIIDSGIDYRNSLFWEGNQSRILNIWDQTIMENTNNKSDVWENDVENHKSVVSRVPFGKVFSKEEIEQAMLSDNPLDIVNSRDENGHGTRLAAIAAGNTVEEEDFSGAAPEASILVIKLKTAKKYLKDFYLLPENAQVFQEDDIMLAISYAMDSARYYQMPLSICIGLGSSQGAHIGASPLCQVVNWSSNFTQNAISVAAGNEGIARHHFQGILDRRNGGRTAELRVGENEPGFTLEFWGELPEEYYVTIQSPTGENLEISTSVGAATQELSFVFVETKVYVNYISVERQSGKTLIFCRFLKPAAGIWKIIVRGRDQNGAVYHMWLPVQGLISENTYFLEASPYETITSPGDAEDAITTTAYQANNGSLYLQASRGFLPTGRGQGMVKPNFAAPGVNIKVPGIAGKYDIESGSSLAAAQTAGAAALLFEWALVRGNEPFFTGNSVKNYLQIGAKREQGMSYPNEEWGYGKLDLYGTFERI